MTQEPVLQAQDLAAIHHRAFSRPWSIDQFQALLDMDGVFALGQPDGFILVRVVADEAEILTLAVDPARRRRGYATALVVAAAEAARGFGAKTLHLEVATGNTAALTLYQACGFVQTGRRRGYYALGNDQVDDALTMALDLVENGGADAPRSTQPLP